MTITPLRSNDQLTQPVVPRLPPYCQMVADTACGAVAVVGHRLDDDSNAAGAVALVGDGFVVVAAAGCRCFFQHALDVVVRHIGGLGLGDDGREAGVIRGVGDAAALLDGYDHFLGDLRKGSRALCVLCALGFLNVMPLGMSGHEVFFPSLQYLLSFYHRERAEVNCFIEIASHLYAPSPAERSAPAAPRAQRAPERRRRGSPSQNGPRR